MFLVDIAQQSGRSYRHVSIQLRNDIRELLCYAMLQRNGTEKVKSQIPNIHFEKS